MKSTSAGYKGSSILLSLGTVAGMWWQRAGLVFALVNAGCISDLDVNLGFEAPVDSAIIITIDEGQISGWALEEGVYRQSHSALGAIEIYLLEYDSSLESLGLKEGELALQLDGSEGTSLPPADRILRQVVTQGSQEEPQVLSELPTRLRLLKLNVGSVAECLDGGGCLAPRARDSALVCKTPCDDPGPVVPPQAPAVVQLGPCAEGWLLVPPVNPEDIAECLPWLVEAECAPGQAQRPGTACIAVGAVCPDGIWPTELESGAVYFVDPGALRDGNGSQAAPYNSVGQVPHSTTATTVIVLAKGMHSISVELPDPVVLQGACALDTQITTSLDLSQGRVLVRDVGTEGLRIAGAQVRLEGVIVNSARPRVIQVLSGTLSAHDISVSGASSVGLYVGDGGEAVVSLARFEGLGIKMEGASQLMLRDSTVLHTLAGFTMHSGAQATLQAVAFEGTTDFAFLVTGAGTELTVDQVLGRGGPEGEANGVVTEASKLIGGRLAFVDNRSYGLNVAAGGQVDLHDLLIRDTVPRSGAPILGMALTISNRAEATIRRAHLVRSTGYGVTINDSAVALLEDVTVIDVLGAKDSVQGWGYGLSTTEASTVELTRMRISGVHGLGMRLETSVEMRATDVDIVDTIGRDQDGSYGRGLEVRDGSHLDMQRLRVHAAKNIGVQVRNLGSTLDVRDLIITQTGHTECFDYDCGLGGGAGLIARQGASIRVDRFIIDSNTNFGARVADQAGLELRNGTISNHPVGTQVLVDGYELELLTRGIRYVDNIQNLSLYGEN